MRIGAAVALRPTLAGSTGAEAWQAALCRWPSCLCLAVDEEMVVSVVAACLYYWGGWSVVPGCPVTGPILTLLRGRSGVVCCHS